MRSIKGWFVEKAIGLVLRHLTSITELGTLPFFYEDDRGRKFKGHIAWRRGEADAA